MLEFRINLCWRFEVFYVGVSRYFLLEFRGILCWSFEVFYVRVIVIEYVELVMWQNWLYLISSFQQFELYLFLKSTYLIAII